MKRRNKSGVFAAIRMAARAHHVLTVGTILCVASSVLASLLPPLLLARIIDGLTAGLPLTLWAVLAYFCSLALEGVLSSAQESLLVLFGQKMTHALRSEMSHKLTQLPASTLVDQNPGEVAARFSGDVDTVEALFTSGIISMVADACRILSIMAVIAVKNTGLALILLLVLPLFAAFTRHVQRRMLAAQLDNRRAVAAVSGQVPETLHNIRTIRALGTEAYMERRYDKRIADGYAAMERTNFYDAIYSPVVLLLNAVVVAIVMLLSASGNATVLTLFGMSVGTSVAIINYISRIFTPIESLGMEIQTIQSAMAGVKRIDAFLTQPERTIPGERQKAARGDVELAHVTFGYGEKQVLNDFSMTVHQGEQVTLIGRTGAGKSTIFKLLLGLYPPESGSVTIGGVPVADITDRERRTCISCVEQHFARVPGTVLDQITLGDPQITAEMAKNAAQLAGIDTAICALPDGYDTVCSEGMFSQGEWQLLSIARAAAADPAVLLLDEITANLDAETEARVLDALRRDVGLFHALASVRRDIHRARHVRDDRNTQVVVDALCHHDKHVRVGRQHNAAVVLGLNELAGLMYHLNTRRDGVSQTRVDRLLQKKVHGKLAHLLVYELARRDEVQHGGRVVGGHAVAHALVGCHHIHHLARHDGAGETKLARLLVHRIHADEVDDNVGGRVITVGNHAASKFLQLIGARAVILYRARARDDVRGRDLHLGIEVDLPRSHLVEKRSQHHQLDHARRGMLRRAVHAHDAGRRAHRKVRHRDGLSIWGRHLLDCLTHTGAGTLDVCRVLGDCGLAVRIRRRN